jgi:fatty-acyl-CoA synthase
MQPERLVPFMVEEQVTLSAGVPTIWQGVKAQIEANPDQYDFSCLQRVTCGGSAPPKSLIRWYWNALQVEMIQGWGMTETSPVMTIARKVAKRSHLQLSEDAQFDNVAKAGLCLPGVEMAIFDADLQPLPHDGEAVGEVLVRGPWVCSQYYHDRQPERFHDGWLITGDVARIDPEQYLNISDRSKDLIKTGGEWISSVDMENHIADLSGVAQACVVAQPHPQWDERPIALVVLRPGSELDAQQILSHCTGRFAKWQLPDDVLFVDAIPLTTTGKMDKKVVRARLQQQGYRLPAL